MLIGRIAPDENGGKPRFQVLNKGYQGRSDLKYDREGEWAGVRPCAHPRFILDEEWSTVTCGECKERLQPFDVLLRHAEYWNDLTRKEQAAKWAHVDLKRQAIRADMKRRGVSDELREQARRLIDGPYRPDADKRLAELSECEKGLEAAHRAWQATRRTPEAPDAHP